MRVAINGFGRIGRLVFKNLLSMGIDVCAINDLTDSCTLAHLLKYDSAYGIYEKEVSYDSSHLIVGKKKIPVFSEKEISKLPWKKLKVDVVLECTGKFLTKELAGQHLKSGAKKVVLSARPKDESIPQYNIGVNEKRYSGEKIISNASCTTNSITPILKLLLLEYGVKELFFTTVHAYTSDQNLIDSPHKDLRRARSAPNNIIPTTTGAVKAVSSIFPDLEGKIEGKAIRVPVLTGSLTNMVVVLGKKTTTEELNSFLKSSSKKFKGIIEYSESPLVSSDIVGNTNSAIIDSLLTNVKENIADIFLWYDNEAGYAKRLAELSVLCFSRK